jgi:seryl-tRNA synthetase
MTSTVTISLREPPTEITREEILKQVAHLSNSLRSPRIPSDGSRLEFDVETAEAESIKPHAEHLCAQIQRSLRKLERKVVYRTRAMDQPVFRGVADGEAGIWMAGEGQAMLEGIPLRLFNYFDIALAEWERKWAPHQLLTPTLIPAAVLAKCDYFRSFPNTVTFACHLQSEAEVLNQFRARHNDKMDVDGHALAEMAAPEACLSPAVCYHVYHRIQGETLPRDGLTYNVRGKCFRYEASNLIGLKRLWDFTMRELVFVGGGESVLEKRQRCVEEIGAFVDRLGIAAEIRTASDPFYIAPDAPSKTYFQLTAETKYEISALLSDNERLAVGSLNYHTDFFGRAFDIKVAEAGPAHSVCIGFGLERLVCAFLAQHGSDPDHWPKVVR